MKRKSKIINWISIEHQKEIWLLECYNQTSRSILKWFALNNDIHITINRQFIHIYAFKCISFSQEHEIHQFYCSKEEEKIQNRFSLNQTWNRSWILLNRYRFGIWLLWQQFSLRSFFLSFFLHFMIRIDFIVWFCLRTNYSARLYYKRIPAELTTTI